MWREIPPPKHKKDWPGSWLILQKDCPLGGIKIPESETRLVRIVRRKNAMDTMHNALDVAHWGSIRVLEVVYVCPLCLAGHRGYIPENWLDEGWAMFVKNEQGATS